MYIIYDNITGEYLSNTGEYTEDEWSEWDGCCIFNENESLELVYHLDGCQMFPTLEEAQKAKSYLEAKFLSNKLKIDFRILRCVNPKTVTFYEKLEEIE